MSTSSSTTLAGATADEVFRQPQDLISGEPCDSSAYSSSISDITQAFHFSSGNPRIEETRGVMLLYRDDVVSFSPKALPVIFFPIHFYSGIEACGSILMFWYFYLQGYLITLIYVNNWNLYMYMLFYVGWKKTSCLCAWSTKSHDICRLLPILWFIYPTYFGNADCQV